MKPKNLLTILFVLMLSVSVIAAAPETCRSVSPNCSYDSDCDAGEFCSAGACCDCTTFGCATACTYSGCDGYDTWDDKTCCSGDGDCIGAMVCTGSCTSGKYCENAGIPEFDSFTVLAAIAIIAVALFVIRKRKLI